MSPEPTPPEPVPNPLDILHGDDTDFPGNSPAGWTPTQSSPDSPASDTHNSPEPVPDITSKGEEPWWCPICNYAVPKGHGGDQYPVHNLAAKRYTEALARIFSLEEEREELLAGRRLMAQRIVALESEVRNAEPVIAAVKVLSEAEGAEALLSATLNLRAALAALGDSHE